LAVPGGYRLLAGCRFVTDVIYSLGDLRFRNDAKGTVDIGDKYGIIGGKDIPPTDNHHIHVDFFVPDSSFCDSIAQTTLDPVTFGGVSDTFGYRQSVTQAGKTFIFLGRAESALHAHTLRMEAAASGRRDKVRSFRQAPDGRPVGSAHQGGPYRTLSRKTLAAPCATGCNDLAAALCRHACTISVATLANELAGLICPFHGLISGRIGADYGRTPRLRRKNRLECQKSAAPREERCLKKAYGGRDKESQRSRLQLSGASFLIEPDIADKQDAIHPLLRY